MDLTLFVIFLGLLQGATEFLPVSSSGHLALAENLPFFSQAMERLEAQFPLLAFNVMLHVGTILSVIIYMAKDIGKIIHNFFLILPRKILWGMAGVWVGW